MAKNDTDTNIAYQNKDIISKCFGEQMKGKPLSLFGLKSDKKVVSIQPTNIPVVDVKELRMDNLFELEDGSIAIVDYESTYKMEDFFKYGVYLLNVWKRYLKEGKWPDIHMMVIPSVGKDTHASTAIFWRLTALTSVGVRPVRLHPLPYQPPKYGD